MKSSKDFPSLARMPGEIRDMIADHLPPFSIVSLLEAVRLLMNEWA